MQSACKSRHEYKFQINEMDLALLMSRISPIMKRDRHTGSKGYYHIRSVYFDDYWDTCYQKNEAGTDPRAKYRIRIYDAGTERITLEKKVKERGKTRKVSAPLTLEQAQMLIEGRCLPMDQQTFSDYPQLLQQFLVLMQTRMMRPKVIVCYDRIPFVDKNGNVRITFDKNIAASTDFSHFFENDLLKVPILPPGIQLLEVKYDEFLPRVIRSQLELGHLRQETFSKYYLCRKRKKG